MNTHHTHSRSAAQTTSSDRLNGRERALVGALPLLDGQFLLFGAAVAFDADRATAGQADADRLVAAVDRWRTGTTYLNFTENSTDSSTAYLADTWARRRAVRSAVDPGNVFHANHPIRPARAVR